MTKMNIKKGDLVQVISGKDRGPAGSPTQGKVLRAIPSDGKVVVEGVAIAKKSVKPNGTNQQGGIIQQEAAIDVSNVALVCPSCGKATRVGHAKDDNGRTVRVCKKCGAKF